MSVVRAVALVLAVFLIALGPYTASRIYVAHHHHAATEREVGR